MRTRHAPASTDGQILIDIHGVAHLAYVSIETVRGLMNAGRFPKGIKLGDRPNSSRRWVRSEVIAFLEAGLPQAGVAEVAHGA